MEAKIDRGAHRSSDQIPNVLSSARSKPVFVDSPPLSGSRRTYCSLNNRPCSRLRRLSVHADGGHAEDFSQ